MSTKYKIGNSRYPHHVTFTVLGWTRIFQIEKLACIFIHSIKHCQVNKSLEVYAWCIMPHHIHLILRSGDSNIKLSSLIRDIKSYTSKKIRKELEDGDENEKKLFYRISYIQSKSNKNSGFQIWKQGYHGVELNNSKLFAQCIDYIHLNPVKAGFTDLPENWKFSSAIDFMDKSKSIIDLTGQY